MDTIAKDAAPTPQAAPLDLPVELSLRIPVFEVTTAEIAAFDGDHVIDLERAIAEVEVEICAAGERIATGRFVSIDGNLGVRIARMEPFEAAGPEV